MANFKYCVFSTESDWLAGIVAGMMGLSGRQKDSDSATHPIPS